VLKSGFALGSTLLDHRNGASKALLDDCLVQLNAKSGAFRQRPLAIAELWLGHRQFVPQKGREEVRID
jgi:hypothetical protein